MAQHETRLKGVYVKLIITTPSSNIVYCFVCSSYIYDDVLELYTFRYRLMRGNRVVVRRLFVCVGLPFVIEIIDMNTLTKEQLSTIMQNGLCTIGQSPAERIDNCAPVTISPPPIPRDPRPIVPVKPTQQTVSSVSNNPTRWGSPAPHNPIPPELQQIKARRQSFQSAPASSSVDPNDPVKAYEDVVARVRAAMSQVIPYPVSR